MEDCKTCVYYVECCNYCRLWDTDIYNVIEDCNQYVSDIDDQDWLED